MPRCGGQSVLARSVGRLDAPRHPNYGNCRFAPCQASKGAFCRVGDTRCGPLSVRLIVDGPSRDRARVPVPTPPAVSWAGARACPDLQTPCDRPASIPLLPAGRRYSGWANDPVEPTSGTRHTGSARVAAGGIMERTASSLMWTAPEVASRIWSARARPLAPPMSAVSPVRSLLAAGPPGDLQHDRAAPVRRRALPLSGCLPSWRAGCRATSETGPACPPTSAPRQPTVPVDCADRQADGIGQPRGFVGAAAAVTLRRAL